MAQVTCRGYVRVSSDEQAEEGYSLDAQRKSIEEFASNKGWRLERIYADEGLSGKNMKRPALQALLADVQRDEILIVWKLDRLSRKLRDQESIFDDLEKRGTRFASIMEPILSDVGSNGTFIRQIFGAFNEQFRRQLAENVRHGFKEMAREGRWYGGGRVPLGYDYVPETDETGNEKRKGKKVVKRLVPNESEAALVRQIFDRYRHGEGAQTIAYWLNTTGIPSPDRAGWSKDEILFIISNPVYIGKLAYKRNARGTPSKHPEAFVVDGDHVPIVDKDVFDAVQLARSSRASLPIRQRNAQYLLTGILYCDHCKSPIGGTTYHRTFANGTPRDYVGYRCRGYVRKGRTFCTLTNVSAWKADESFLQALEDLEKPGGVGVRKLLEDQERQKETSKKDVEIRKGAAQGELKKIDGALAELNRAYLFAKAYTDSEFVALKNQLTAEREAQEAILREPIPTGKTLDLDKLTAMVKGIRALWSEGTSEERKALILNLVNAYHIKPLLSKEGEVHFELEA